MKYKSSAHNIFHQEINKTLQILVEAGLIESRTEHMGNAKKPSEKWFVKTSALRT